MDPALLVNFQRAPPLPKTLGFGVNMWLHRDLTLSYAPARNHGVLVRPFATLTAGHIVLPPRVAPSGNDTVFGGSVPSGK